MLALVFLGDEGGEPLPGPAEPEITGPATPLVLSFTTVGQVANVGLSYRSTVFSGTDVERLMRGGS